MAGISVLPARHDDDDDDVYIYIYIYIYIMCVYIYIYIYISLIYRTYVIGLAHLLNILFSKWTT